MNLLAIDTSTDFCSVAASRDRELFHRHEPAAQRQAEMVLGMLDTVLAQAQLEFAHIDGIAFGAGPGSFTGLRIACGIAQGLAFAGGLPVAAVGTLECLAEASGEARVLSALDARMGEVYIGAFERSVDAWRIVIEPVLRAPQDAPEVEGTWAGCGSGFAVHGEALARRYGGQLSSVSAALFPHAREVATLGMRILERGEGVDAALAAPFYIRDKVALTISERAARKAQKSAVKS
jgi:tRNA threonylcarbamoyladenosine biosynthesis protein TsaB